MQKGPPVLSTCFRWLLPLLLRPARRRDGAGAVEYALLFGVIAVAILATVAGTGNRVAQVFCRAGDVVGLAASCDSAGAETETPVGETPPQPPGTAPQLIAATASGTYGIGQTVTVALLFSQPVQGEGTAQFRLGAAGSVLTAPVTMEDATHGSMAYTVREGDGSGALIVRGVTGLTNGDGEPVAHYPQTGSGAAADATPPQLQDIAVAPASAQPGDVAIFTATFSEPVQATESWALSLHADGTARDWTALPLPGQEAASPTIDFSYTVVTADRGTVGLTVTGLAGAPIDSAGNALRGATAGAGIAFTVPQPSLCMNTDGTPCPDGSYYAGALAGRHLYVTATDSPRAHWSDESVQRGAGSATDGAANTAAMLVGGAALYPAAAVCDGLDAHGRTDWYLGAMEEMAVLDACHDLGHCGSHVSRDFWTSTELTATTARAVAFNDNGSIAEKTTTKNQNRDIRCMRSQ